MAKAKISTRYSVFYWLCQFLSSLFEGFRRNAFLLTLIFKISLKNTQIQQVLKPVSIDNEIENNSVGSQIKQLANLNKIKKLSKSRKIRKLAKCKQ